MPAPLLLTFTVIGYTISLPPDYYTGIFALAVLTFAKPVLILGFDVLYSHLTIGLSI